MSKGQDKKKEEKKKPTKTIKEKRLEKKANALVRTLVWNAGRAALRQQRNEVPPREFRKWGRVEGNSNPWKFQVCRTKEQSVH